ncbi:MAG: hypothetical protein E6Q97_14660 [Desulfurellales bacterium]|nr:MAG: hypothetical protein E6Q97_14660 [Desulfurellales bacterium]
MTWFAARIAPQKEAKAHDLLAAHGFESLFAHEVREVRRLRHKRYANIPVIRPLLPSYALIRHDGTPDWERRAAALEWPGGARVIYAWVGYANRPWPIPQPSIDALAAMSGQISRLPNPRILAAGSAARVTGGPFSGFKGRVEAIRDRRVMLLLGMFGAERAVEIPADQVEAA